MGVMESIIHIKDMTANSKLKELKGYLDKLNAGTKGGTGWQGARGRSIFRDRDYWFRVFRFAGGHPFAEKAL